MIEPEYGYPEDEAEEQRTNVATIAIIGFMAGLVLWMGAACLVLGSGGDGSPSSASPGAVSTPRGAAPTATAAAFRTDCAAIRGTDYRSEAERQWFLANCS